MAGFQHWAYANLTVFGPKTEPQTGASQGCPHNSVPVTDPKGVLTTYDLLRDHFVHYLFGQC